MKIQDLIIENVNTQILYHILEHYGLQSRIVFKYYKAYYDFNTDTINLPRAKVDKDIIISLLHEINHALDRKKMGASKFEREYGIASNQSMIDTGHDPFENNKYEKQADKFADNEYNKKWKNYLKNL